MSFTNSRIAHTNTRLRCKKRRVRNNQKSGTPDNYRSQIDDVHKPGRTHKREDGTHARAEKKAPTNTVEFKYIDAGRAITTIFSVMGVATRGRGDMSSRLKILGGLSTKSFSLV